MYSWTNYLIDVLLEDEIFGPVCPVIKADFRRAYTATKQ